MIIWGGSVIAHFLPNKIMKTAELHILDGCGQIESLEYYAEEYADGQDEICQRIKTIENKCQAIDALFESIQTDLFVIEDSHFDDNGRDIAQSIKRKFKEVYDCYYWKVHEAETESQDLNSWMFHSYLGMLWLLVKDNRETLVIPKIRENYFDLVKTENLSDEEKENELESYINHIRQQFNLSEDFK